MLSKHFQDRLQEHRPRLISRANGTLFYLSLAGLLLFVYDLGFAQSAAAEQGLSVFYGVYALVLVLLMVVRLFLLNRAGVPGAWVVVECGLILVAACGAYLSFFPEHFVYHGTLLGRYVEQDLLIVAVLLYVFFIELSRRSLTVYRLRYSPALLFIASFVLLIALGAGLLLLPRATTSGISPLDALFTSASAVCVTGLLTTDLATDFTTFGQVVVLVLIQLGGLGIMTFTSFLTQFFQRSSSFQNQLFMQGLVSEESVGQTMRTIGNIVGITFLVEALGTALIYVSLDPALMPHLHERLGFAVFHAVSAFCNAGFSTLPAGLYHADFRFNYGFQLSITWLVLIGGIGFPIIFNLYRYLRARAYQRWRQLYFRERYVYVPRLINLNTKVVLITSAALLAVGTVAFFALEYHNTLAEHRGAGKLAAALFGGVMPRSAGFSGVDMAQLTLPLLLVYMLLMWIGSSPASTGGGIKTTTFALAVLNIYSIARGKEQVELFGRHVPARSVQQAFAVMMLSFLVVGLATLALAALNPGVPLFQIAFEAFAAYSTAGLTLGITAGLSAGSKVVLILTMLLGRVGTFTLIAGVVRKANAAHYRYPSENIIIT